jgi:acetoin utilization deacetylase AcuC-like enzyme
MSTWPGSTTRLARACASFEPDLICYIAGADPYGEDQLGAWHSRSRG